MAQRSFVHAIMGRSPILKEIFQTGAIGIIGGNHDITTGEVSFYNDTLIVAYSD